MPIIEHEGPDRFSTLIDGINGRWAKVWRSMDGEFRGADLGLHQRLVSISLDPVATLDWLTRPNQPPERR